MSLYFMKVNSRGICQRNGSCFGSCHHTIGDLDRLELGMAHVALDNEHWKAEHRYLAMRRPVAERECR
jgi:hypothetical protein